MKKWIVLLLLLCLCLPAAASGEAAQAAEASAQTEAVTETAAQPETLLELSSFTDAELRTLLMQLQAEFVARGLRGTALLPGGTYVGGLDLPVGSYVISTDGESEDYQSGVLRLKPLQSEEEAYRLEEYVGNDNAYSYYVRIGEGDVLTLPFTHTISVYTGLDFK